MFEPGELHVWEKHGPCKENFPQIWKVTWSKYIKWPINFPCAPPWTKQPCFLMELELLGKSKHEETSLTPFMWCSRSACSTPPPGTKMWKRLSALLLFPAKDTGVPSAPMSKHSFSPLDCVTVMCDLPQNHPLQLFQPAHGCELFLCLFFSTRELRLTEA